MLKLVKSRLKKAGTHLRSSHVEKCVLVGESKLLHTNVSISHSSKKEDSLEIALYVTTMFNILGAGMTSLRSDMMTFVKALANE
jgi:hypothetical protein